MTAKLVHFLTALPGIIFDYAGSSAPPGFLLCAGQAVSRATYSQLFDVIGTTYGAGDGSTTFNVPDLRGRVSAGKDDMGGTAASVLNVTLSGTRAATANGIITGLSSTAALSVGMKAVGTGIGANAAIASIDSATQITLSVNSTATGTANIRFGVVDGATLGDKGGAHTHTLTTGQMPAHNHGVTDPGHTHAMASGQAWTNGGPQTWGGGTAGSIGVQAIVANTTGITIQNQGGGAAHSNTQPTMVLNKIIKH